MNALKEVIKYIVIFLVSVVLLATILVATEFISKDSMKKNMLSSAEKMCENTVGVEMMKGVPASKLDRYADDIWLGIAWQTDSEHPLTSAMWSSYYVNRDPADVNGANQDLLEAVKDDKDGTLQYLRYWHGAVAPIRLLHLFTDITGIYVIGTIALIGLFAALFILMWRYGMKGEAVCLIVASLIAGIWYTPLCLEYIWIFLIIPCVSIPALIWCKNERWSRVWALFLISGIVTNFFDFLTTEVLTLLIPLLLVVSLQGRKEVKKDDKNTPIRISIKACILWGFGYLGMWAMKWIIASIILGENVMPYVTGHIAQRVGVSDAGTGNPLSALYLNLITIFPAGMGDIWAVITLIVLIILGCVLYVYKGNNIRKKYIIAYIVLGLLPYIRYMVLFDHSFRHFAFTYRSQMATALAIGLMSLEIIDERVFRHERKKA